MPIAGFPQEFPESRVSSVCGLRRGRARQDGFSDDAQPLADMVDELRMFVDEDDATYLFKS